MNPILPQTLQNPPGSTYVYSDLSMITMMHVVGVLARYVYSDLSMITMMHVVGTLAR